jgi:hypothetical protein
MSINQYAIGVKMPINTAPNTSVRREAGHGALQFG